MDLIKKSFIGFDLGDGESIIDFMTLDGDDYTGAIQTRFRMMTMPGSSEAGRAIPTAFAYDSDGQVVFGKSIVMMSDHVYDVQLHFKQKPGNLLQNLTQTRKEELLSVLKAGSAKLSEMPELNTEAIKAFSNTVVTFTDAVFHHPSIIDVMRSEAADSEEIVFCVGYPTKWDDLDIGIYRAILQSSILGKGEYAGKKSSLLLAPESTALYLSMKDKTSSAPLPEGAGILLIDAGSSTLELTCVSAGTRTILFNRMNTYLGVRGIDCLVKELVLNELKSRELENHREPVVLDREYDKILTLVCRLAKEDVYSSGIGIGRVFLGDTAPVRISREDIDIAVTTHPLAYILMKDTNLPKEQKAEMGESDWRYLFRRFLVEQKMEINRAGISVGRIILTGGASRMPIVSAVVEDVFSEVAKSEIIADMNPSRSVSVGLALYAYEIAKQEPFQREIYDLLDEKLEKIICDSLPDMAEKTSSIIANAIAGILRSNMKDWRSGEIPTLNDMSQKIEAECSGGNLENLLNSSVTYQTAVNSWITEQLGRDLAVELHRICKKYAVDDVSLDDLNVLRTSDIRVSTNQIEPIKSMTDMAAIIIQFVVGLIVNIILAKIVSILFSVVFEIVTDISFAIFGVALTSPAGLAVFAVMEISSSLFVMKKAGKGLDKGFDVGKDLFMSKVKDAVLPLSIRGILSDVKIEQEIENANLKAAIRDAILSDESRKEIIEQLSQKMKQTTEHKFEEIKNLIEVR